jgi:hypothetical protein
MQKTEISADQIREALNAEYKLSKYSDQFTGGLPRIGIYCERMTDVLRIGFLLHQSFGKDVVFSLSIFFNQIVMGGYIYFPAIAWEE